VTAHVASPITFEVERFELVDDERLELTGRWFGVRGRRFVRPTLTVPADGGESRALALLDHKPWHVLDGQPWVAAFPWPHSPEALVDAELAVATDIAVPLPDLSRAGEPARRPPRATRKSGAATNGRRTNSATKGAELQRRLERERGEAKRLLQELTRLRKELEQGAGELDALRTARTELEAQRDALIGERDRLRRERYDARKAASRADAQTELALSELTEARVKLEEFAGERDALAARHREALARLEGRSRERDRLGAEREELIAERRALGRQRQALAEERDRLAEELAHAQRTRVVAEPPDRRTTRAPSTRATREPGTRWGVRALALTGLLGLVIAIAAIVQSV
jgi:hypothetical protein